jgi:hypothetical protein
MFSQVIDLGKLSEPLLGISLGLASEPGTARAPGQVSRGSLLDGA